MCILRAITKGWDGRRVMQSQLVQYQCTKNGLEDPSVCPADMSQLMVCAAMESSSSALGFVDDGVLSFYLANMFRERAEMSDWLQKMGDHLLWDCCCRAGSKQENTLCIYLLSPIPSFCYIAGMRDHKIRRSNP